MIVGAGPEEHVQYRGIQNRGLLLAQLEENVEMATGCTFQTVADETDRVDDLETLSFPCFQSVHWV